MKNVIVIDCLNDCIQRLQFTVVLSVAILQISFFEYFMVCGAFENLPSSHTTLSLNFCLSEIFCRVSMR